MTRAWLLAAGLGIVIVFGGGAYWLFGGDRSNNDSSAISVNASTIAAGTMAPPATSTAASASTPAGGDGGTSVAENTQPADNSPGERNSDTSSDNSASSGSGDSGAGPAQLPTCFGSAPAPATEFVSNRTDASYCAIGHLVPGSGAGEQDAIDWAPGIRFPLDQAPAFANSQVWGVGGMSGPPGGQGDARNYSYPWHDNFCESRAYRTIVCPAGHGHQGQDIRPAKCCDVSGRLLQDTFVVDAVEDGRISSIGTYTVYLVGDSGRLYRYLHMDMKRLMVEVNDRVTRGQPIGYVSNYFGRSVTTFHLHFEIKAPVTQNGTTVYTWVSPYPSLVTAYANLLEGHP